VSRRREAVLVSCLQENFIIYRDFYSLRHILYKCANIILIYINNIYCTQYDIIYYYGGCGARYAFITSVIYTHITALDSCRGVCDEIFVHFILFLKKPRHIIGIGRLPVHRKTHIYTDEKSS